MNYVVSSSLLIAGVIHLLPITGAFGTDQLHRLYGVALDDPNLEVLMRHRAVLFGILGAFLCTAAFLKNIQTAAFLTGLFSASAFAWIAYRVGGWGSVLNASMLRVVAGDWVAISALLTGLAVHGWLIFSANPR